MNDPDEIWLTADCSKCHLTLPDARWKDPGPCTLNLGCEKDGTRYTPADLAEAREERLAEALRRLGKELRKAPLEIIPCVGSLTPIEHALGLAWEALAEHDKGGDDG